MYGCDSEQTACATVDFRASVCAKLAATLDAYHLYGPIEATVDVGHLGCRDDGGKVVPIGNITLART